jgi:hypothetical protein
MGRPGVVLTYRFDLIFENRAPPQHSGGLWRNQLLKKKVEGTRRGEGHLPVVRRVCLRTRPPSFSRTSLGSACRAMAPIGSAYFLRRAFFLPAFFADFFDAFFAAFFAVFFFATFFAAFFATFFAAFLRFFAMSYHLLSGT